MSPDTLSQAERKKPRLRDQRVTLAHGSGGQAMHELIQALFVQEFDNPLLSRLDDQAVFDVAAGRMAFTTDSYVVQPPFFPGGDIGCLAVNGTVNDLAMAGARPLCISCGLILEEGLPIEDLRRVVRSMKRAADEAGVPIVTGDTKVVARGAADRLFVNTSGVGVVTVSHEISARSVQVGDQVIVSGTLGDHGMAVMLARGELALESEIRSDTAALWSLVEAMLRAGGEAVHVLRDPTRGGLATVLNEIAEAGQVFVLLRQQAIAIREDVQGACELLGLDPLYVANEGKLVATVAPHAAEAVLQAMRMHPHGRDAAIVGEVRAEPAAMVAMQTPFGGTRVVDMLVGDQLPRIC